MRLLSQLIVPVFAAVLVAACGSSSPAPSQGKNTVATSGTTGNTSSGGASSTTTTGASSTSSGATSGDAPCAAGQWYCGPGQCVVLESDNANCGACGNQCGAGSSCVNGGCQCQPGLWLCEEGCVDISSNPTHCGDCGSVCGAGQVCSMGACSDGCAAGETDCASSCVNLSDNVLNCGVCGAACAAGEACVGGSCDCAAGQTSCAGQCVDTMTNAAHCGGCDIACGADQSCTAGSCDCAATATTCDGACVNTMTSAEHCGACNNACPSGMGCNSGSCICNNGMTDCSGTCVNLDTDAGNCGSCGNACESGGCNAGTCTEIDTSLVGWASVSGEGVNTTIGGNGGSTVSVSTANELVNGVSGDEPRIVEVSGSINIGELEMGSNKTLRGVGANAVINGGIQLDGVTNVIVQNLGINAASTTTNGDGIHMQGSHHIWIDHVEIWDAPDGNLDINDASNWVTVSWSIFRYSNPAPADDHRFSNLVGSSDDDTQDQGRLKVTYHHNWWGDRVHERMPRVRFGQVHIFNNYYSSSGNNYCIRAGYQANLLVENNYFEGVDTPHEIDGTGAVISASGNVYNATTGAEDAPGGAFSPPYSYSPETAESARGAVMANAGPQ